MAASATTTGIRVSRPSIFVGGQEDLALAQGLLQMTVSESVHGLYHCELRFGNWGPVQNSIGFLYFDRKKLDFGKAMQVKVATSPRRMARLSFFWTSQSWTPRSLSAVEATSWPSGENVTLLTGAL